MLTAIYLGFNQNVLKTILVRNILGEEDRSIPSDWANF
jgi:hypothetical protein